MATQVIKTDGSMVLPSTAGLSNRLRRWSGKFLQALSGYLWSTEDSDQKYRVAQSAASDGYVLALRSGLRMD